MGNEYFEVMFKTPDAVQDTIDEDYPETEEDDNQDAVDKRTAALKVAKKFVKYGEYVRIRFYLDGRAEVRPAS